MKKRIKELVIFFIFMVIILPHCSIPLIDFASPEHINTRIWSKTKNNEIDGLEVNIDVDKTWIYVGNTSTVTIEAIASQNEIIYIDIYAYLIYESNCGCERNYTVYSKPNIKLNGTDQYNSFNDSFLLNFTVKGDYLISVVVIDVTHNQKYEKLISISVHEELELWIDQNINDINVGNITELNISIYNWGEKNITIDYKLILRDYFTNTSLRSNKSIFIRSKDMFNDIFNYTYKYGGFYELILSVFVYETTKTKYEHLVFSVFGEQNENNSNSTTTITKTTTTKHSVPSVGLVTVFLIMMTLTHYFTRQKK